MSEDIKIYNPNEIENSTEIGGYFGLELPDYGNPFPDSLKFQSSRAALRAVLEATAIKKIILPVYICESVAQAAIDSGVVVERYRLDDSLYPEYLPNPIPKESVLLYVNYFGLCGRNVERISKTAPKKQLIIDNSQALFSKPTDALATIYSIRKFIGVPDGGMLVSNGVSINIPEDEDTGSITRMRHILLRIAYSACTGFPSYIESEKTLVNTKPLKMSRLTKRLLSSIDLGAVKERRKENFKELSLHLDKFNKFKWDIDADVVPLCYPLLVEKNVDELKEELIDKGIFIPTYWPDIKLKDTYDSLEYRLSNCCLFVPCDQRYTTSQMKELAIVISAGLKILLSTKS